MYEFNLLTHIPDDIVTTDKSNIWKNGQILDIPVYTPNSISVPGGISIYGEIDPFQYAFYHNESSRVNLLYGLDPKGRYTFEEVGVDHTYFKYKFGGRSFPQSRITPHIHYESNKLYISGGLIESDGMDDAWLYDMTTETWYIEPSLPSPRWSHSMLYAEDKIYLFGGQTASRIDDRRLWLNDLFWTTADRSDGWNLLDRDALLPHAEGTVLGEDGGYVYLLIEKKVWQVTIENEITNELIGTYELEGKYITDTLSRPEGTYLFVKKNKSDRLGHIYLWTAPTNFTLKVSDTICWDTEDLTSIIDVDQEEHIRIDGLKLGGEPPPKRTNETSHCRAGDLDAYYRLGYIWLFDAEHFHTEQITLDSDQVPARGYLSYHLRDHSLYLVGWMESGHLRVGKLDLDSRVYTVLNDVDYVVKRDFSSSVIVQDTIWLIGGHTPELGYVKDQWRFDILGEATWVEEITLEPLPQQPFQIFEWRERMWIIPHIIRSLYRYYPSMRQWDPVYISRGDTAHQEMGLMSETVSWSVIDNKLIIEPRGYNKIAIELEARRANEVIYGGKLWVAIDRAHILNADGRLFVSDGTVMQTTIPDQPPHFENSGCKMTSAQIEDAQANDLNFEEPADGIKGTKLAASYPYMISGYNDLGEYKPAYSDMVGYFWIDNVDVKWHDFDERIGFYIPETDYAGDPGDHLRRIPTMNYYPRSSEPLLSALGDIEFSNSRFVINENQVTRYRTQDGTYFKYKAPVSLGSAVACSSDGRVFIFGGRTNGDVLSLDQNGLYHSSELQIGTGEEAEEAELKCQPTFVLYDLNYAKGEIEYLADIPDFYERHDYDVAADHLISRLRQILSPDDAVSAAEVEKMEENYYNTVQAIIDDIAVRYITYESGIRPSSRSWPVYCQVDDYFFVGGGAFEFEPPPGGQCPPLWTYPNTNENYRDPDEEFEETDEFVPDYLYSGNYVDNPILNDFYRFDIIQNVWTTLTRGPWEHLFHATTVVTPDKTEIWVIGGYTNSSMTTRSTDIFIYTLAQGTWRTFENIPKGYLGRARPAVKWLDDDTLMIMYGSICTITTCGDCPCYWFNSLGDSWIVHRPTGVMYKYESDLPKTFTIMPNDQDEPYIDLLYIPNDSPAPGGQTDITQTLAMSRMFSEDWSAYEEKYEYALKEVYDQLEVHYKDETFVNADGEQASIEFPEFDGGNSVVQLYNDILPNLDPKGVYNDYKRYVRGSNKWVLLKDTVVPLRYIEAYDEDFTLALIFELSSRSSQDILNLEKYELLIRDIFVCLDRITGTLYPANRITPEDLLLVRKSMLTGEYTEVKKVIQSKTVQFSLDGIKDIFKDKIGDWWLVGYFLQKGTTEEDDEGFLRLYRFSDRPDGDIDLMELAVDMPLSSEPFAIGYDNMDHLFCVFNKFNIWRLNLDMAINKPDGDYWRRLPPALNYGKHFNNEMRHLVKDNYMLFFDAYGLVLSYDMDNFVWDLVRDTIDKSKDNSYVVVDNTELYYIGGSTGYFDTRTFQGDRFVVNSDVCEFGIGTPVMPRLIVQRNLVVGFDVNNNMVSAFVRKRGTFDKTWAFPNYFYIERILVSVDYDSLEYADDIEIYVKTPDGVSRYPAYKDRAQEPWSFNPFIRMYDNDKSRTHIPDQYLAVDVNGYVAEFQVIFTPPIKNYGYVSRVNAVLAVPKRSEKLTATDYYVACEDEIDIGINNSTDSSKYLMASTDDADLAITWTKEDYSDRTDTVVAPHSQRSLKLKALHSGKVTHLMVINNKSKE